jgi:hypothetical protein
LMVICYQKNFKNVLFERFAFVTLHNKEVKHSAVSRLLERM